ncbi:protein DCL homolog, chloroplastic-like [Olea europaea var. sylvestris]|uniref:protein DCL homolog, chloroplastic-like n=1 Tax=Olea europaea var. sylvestris TaxID=158386 RepID=UPI000C1CD01B|nr:protein DCL homolog, chloroplastic-like [Olea europaea var. sylvestris]
MVERMAATLLRALPLLRVRLLHQHHFRLTAGSITRRPWCSAAESAPTDKNSSSSSQINTGLSAEDPKYSKWDDSDFRKWKEKEAEILEDIEPIICLTKEILHSDRYMDGERLTAEDEKAVVDKLLSYHPHSEDKIGCGIDSIMVDRHPQFKCSRCLFVVRTDGGWIDFSYQKCLRAHIQDEYPSYGERFIKEHFKHSSG